ncbi:MAG: hypothetical protein WAW86_09150 [Gammaproteobacteria bacterium]
MSLGRVLKSNDIKKLPNLNQAVSSLRDAHFIASGSTRADVQANKLYAELSRGKTILVIDTPFSLSAQHKKVGPASTGLLVANPKITSAIKDFLKEKLDISDSELKQLEDNWSQHIYGMVVADSFAMFGMDFAAAESKTFKASQDNQVVLKRDLKGRLVVDALLIEISIENIGDPTQKITFPGQITSRFILENGQFKLQYLACSNPLLEKLALTKELYGCSFNDLKKYADDTALKEAAAIQFDTDANANLGLLAKKIQKIGLKHQLEKPYELFILLKQVLEQPLTSINALSSLEKFADVGSDEDDLANPVKTYIRQFVNEAKLEVKAYNDAYTDLKELVDINASVANRASSNVLKICQQIANDPYRKISFGSSIRALKETAECIRNPTPKQFKRYQQHIDELPRHGFARQLKGAMKCVAAALLIAAFTTVSTISAGVFAAPASIALVASIYLIKSGIDDIKQGRKEVRQAAVLSKPLKIFLAGEQEKLKKITAHSQTKQNTNRRSIFSAPVPKITPEEPNWVRDNPPRKPKPVK